MKFKNITNKTQFVKMGKEFLIVKPNNTIELPQIIMNDKRFIYVSDQEKKKIEVEKREIVIEEKKPKGKMDINNDGKFDKKDVSLAGKVLRRFRKEKKKDE